MEIIISKRFKKQAQKLAESKTSLRKKIDLAIIEFSQKGKKAACYRKSLKGSWYGFDELQVGGDIRIVVRINKAKDVAVLEHIGSHSQLGL